MSFIENELGVAAQALKKDYPHHLEKIKAADLKVEYFQDEYARRVFVALADGVDLHDDEQLSRAGLFRGGMYFELVKDDPSVSGGFAENLAALVERQQHFQRQDIAKRLIAGDDPMQLAAEAQRINAQKPQKVVLLERLEARRLKASAPPPEPVTRLFLAGKPIATPGNLVNVISRAKTGKTAGVGAMVAAAVAASLGNTEADTLKFTAPNPEGKALLVFDTEQSMYDAHCCHMRSLKRADSSDDPAWLHAYGVVGWSPDELHAILRPAMQQARKTNGGIFAVVLDGVADFVLDVNDPKESNALVTDLHGLAGEYDCPIITVIHSNEGASSGPDGRGHLGKQLTRKGETNLLFTKDGEITTITSEKQRKAPITVADNVAFKYSEDEGRHVSCDAPAKAKEAQKKADLTDLAVEAFGSRSAMKWTELCEAIMNARTITKNPAGEIIKKMQKAGVIKTNLVRMYELVK